MSGADDEVTTGGDLLYMGAVALGYTTKIEHLIRSFSGEG